MISVIGKQFSARLGEAVEQDSRSLAEIAKHSGYHRNYIQRVIHGHKTNPTLGFVEVMAISLQRDPAWLLGIAN